MYVYVIPVPFFSTINGQASMSVVMDRIEPTSDAPRVLEITSPKRTLHLLPKLTMLIHVDNKKWKLILENCSKSTKVDKTSKELATKRPMSLGYIASHSFRASLRHGSTPTASQPIPGLVNVYITNWKINENHHV